MGKGFATGRECLLARREGISRLVEPKTRPSVQAANRGGRHLTEDRQEAVAQGQEVLGPSQVAEQLEGAVDHVTGTRGDLGAAAEAGEMVADVAVVLLDREGQVRAREQSILRDQPVEALP